MRVPYILTKARKAKGVEEKDQSNSLKSSIPDFSKPDEESNKDKGYKPAVMRGLPEPPSEGDLLEFHHPKHGMKTRGRVTAVGQDGYRARIADGSALDVPHSHTIATLPVADYGTESKVSPQDAKESFLGPTKEGQLPATPLQIAVLDVLGQYGFPVDEETIHTINYDQAKRVITKYLMDDRSVNQMPDTGEGAGGKEGGGGQDGAASKDDTSMGQDGAAGEEGLDDSGGGSDEEGEAPGGQQKPQMTPGTSQGPTGPTGSPGPPGPPSSAPGGSLFQQQDGGVSKDGTGSSGDDQEEAVEDDEGVMDDPEVKEAVEQLISALQTSSEVPGTPDPEEIKGPQDAKKNPRVKSKIAALVNASTKRKPNGKK